MMYSIFLFLMKISPKKHPMMITATTMIKLVTVRTLLSIADSLAPSATATEKLKIDYFALLLVKKCINHANLLQNNTTTVKANRSRYFAMYGTLMLRYLLKKSLPQLLHIPSTYELSPRTTLAPPIMYSMITVQPIRNAINSPTVT